MNEDQLQEAIARVIISYPHIGLYYCLTDFDFRSDLPESVPAFTVKDKVVTVNTAVAAKLKPYHGNLTTNYSYRVNASGVATTTIEGALLHAFDAADEKNELNNEFVALTISMGIQDLAVISQETVNKYSSFTKRQIATVDVNDLDLTDKSNEFKFDAAISVANIMKINQVVGTTAMKLLPVNYQVVATKHIPTKLLAEFIERTEVRDVAEKLMAVIFGV